MHILKFDSEAAWADTAASLWRDRLRDNPRLRLCLPAGNTPKPIYAALVKSVAAQQVSFREATVFALDEYGGLAADDPGGCANMLRHCLVSHIDLPPGQFHWLDAQAEDRDQVCGDYDAAIGRGFDLTLLGLGLNGHLGLNEPGTAPDSTTHRTQMQASSIRASRGYVTGPQLPTWGLTVGLQQLLASPEVWLLARGTAKAEVVRQVVLGPPTAAVPASLLQRHPNCCLMVDAAAGALL